MKKFFILLFVSCLVCMNSFGDEIILQPRQEDDPPLTGGGKSLNNVEALLEDNILSLFFTPSAFSQVVITDSQTNTVVYSGAFGVASSQVIPLSSLPAGVYVLSIYAFGEWWEGEFELTEE